MLTASWLSAIAIQSTRSRKASVDPASKLANSQSDRPNGTSVVTIAAVRSARPFVPGRKSSTSRPMIGENVSSVSQGKESAITKTSFRQSLQRE